MHHFWPVFRFLAPHFVPLGLGNDIERLLQVSHCLHQGLFSKTPSWILKLSKLRAICTPQIQAICSYIVEGLHTQGGIAREHECHVKSFVHRTFISAVQSTQSIGVQCDATVQSLVEPAESIGVQYPVESAELTRVQCDTPDEDRSHAPIPCPPGDPTCKPAHAQPCTPYALQQAVDRFGKYGIVVDTNQLLCQCCIKKGFSLKQVADHIIIDDHEARVWATDWKCRVHMVAGFARRQDVHAADDARRKEAAQKKRRETATRGPRQKCLPPTLRS